MYLAPQVVAVAKIQAVVSEMLREVVFVIVGLMLEDVCHYEKFFLQIIVYMIVFIV